LRFLLKFVDIFSIINTNHVHVCKSLFKVSVILVYSTKIRMSVTEIHTHLFGESHTVPCRQTRGGQ